MNIPIIVALIAMFTDLVVTIITVIATNNKTRSEMQTHMAVQDERMRTLTESVERHNGFAERIPKLELRIEMMEKIIEKLGG